eukprot:scaffold1.g5714.t1
MSRAKAAATLCRRALSARALAASPPAPPLVRRPGEAGPQDEPRPKLRDRHRRRDRRRRDRRRRGRAAPIAPTRLAPLQTRPSSCFRAPPAGGTTLRVFGYQVPYRRDGERREPGAGLVHASWAAEAAKERTGATVVPLFLGLDPAHDRPDHLRKIAQAAGSPALLALTGDADGVLACADKFKKQELAARMAAMKDQAGAISFGEPQEGGGRTTRAEHYKRDDVYDAMDISDFVFLISPEGHFVKCWPRDSPVTGIATEVAQYIKS